MAGEATLTQHPFTSFHSVSHQQHLYVMGDTAQSRSSPYRGWLRRSLPTTTYFSCAIFACNIYRIRVTRLVGGRQLLLQEVISDERVSRSCCVIIFLHVIYVMGNTAQSRSSPNRGWLRLSLPATTYFMNM
jgi:hypothetical protein